MDKRDIEKEIREHESAMEAFRHHRTLSVVEAEERALLDNFAMAALTGLLAWDSSLPFPGLAHDAYAMADAMMDQRKRRMEAK